MSRWRRTAMFSSVLEILVNAYLGGLLQSKAYSCKRNENLRPHLVRSHSYSLILNQIITDDKLLISKPYPYSLKLNLHAVLARTTHARLFCSWRGQLQSHRAYCYLKANDLAVGFQSAPNASWTLKIAIYTLMINRPWSCGGRKAGGWKKLVPLARR